jgi:hypothetical protein
MSIFKNLFSRVVLALALSGAAGAALAVPVTYHVNVDTTSLSGQGLLDLAFIGAGSAETATAVLTNFTGSFGGVYDSFGAISGNVASSVMFANTAGDNYLTQVVNFGGMFGFDVMFDFLEADQGTSFAVNAYLPEFSGYAFGERNLVVASLNPGATVTLLALTPFASIAAITADVPEPNQWMLMLTGLLLLGAMARRRNS